MMTDKPEQDLAAFFDAAKQSPPMPSAALMDAIARDALAEIPTQRVQPLRPQKHWGRAILRGLGGWKPVFALATCASLGVIIGYSAPDRLPVLRGIQTQTADILIEDSFSVASDIEILFQEG